MAGILIPNLPVRRLGIHQAGSMAVKVASRLGYFFISIIYLNGEDVTRLCGGWLFIMRCSTEAKSDTESKTDIFQWIYTW